MSDLCYRSNELSTHTSHFAFRALYNIGSYIDSNTIKGYIFNYIIARIERLNQSDLNGKRPQHIRQWHSGSLIFFMRVQCASIARIPSEGISFHLIALCIREMTQTSQTIFNGVL